MADRLAEWEERLASKFMRLCGLMIYVLGSMAQWHSVGGQCHLLGYQEGSRDWMSRCFWAQEWTKAHQARGALGVVPCLCLYSLAFSAKNPLTHDQGHSQTMVGTYCMPTEEFMNKSMVMRLLEEKERSG